VVVAAVGSALRLDGGRAVSLDEDARRGPHHPVMMTPTLVPGAARRTTTIDAALPTRPDERLELTLAGRDVVLGVDGPRTEERQSIGLSLDFGTRRIEGVTSDPSQAIDGLRGAAVGPGFRKHLVSVLSPDRPATLVDSLLDQLPGAAFLVGYTLMVDDPPSVDSPAVRSRFESRVDLCAGYTATGTIGTWVTELGHSPVPRGPQAPDLRSPDPDAWHELPSLAPLSFRRARRIDVGPVLEGGVVEVDAMFRDINVSRDGVQTVLHEYSLRVQIDAVRGVVVGALARPQVLPWQECPVAAASAGRVVGVPVAELRRWVGRNLSGPSTCTHLNEALRALADVDALLRAAE
jgi:hypothetical protein